MCFHAFDAKWVRTKCVHNFVECTTENSSTVKPSERDHGQSKRCLARKTWKRVYSLARFTRAHVYAVLLSGRSHTSRVRLLSLSFALDTCSHCPLIFSITDLYIHTDFLWVCAAFFFSFFCMPLPLVANYYRSNFTHISSFFSRKIFSIFNAIINNICEHLFIFILLLLKIFVLFLFIIFHLPRDVFYMQRTVEILS